MSPDIQGIRERFPRWSGDTYFEKMITLKLIYLHITKDSV